MKLLSVVLILFAAQISFAAAPKKKDISVGALVITCTQPVGELTQPYYTATVYASENGEGTIVVTNQGVVVFVAPVTTGGNGDTFATANGKDVSFAVDAEDMYSGAIRFKKNGKVTEVNFESDYQEDFRFAACSPTPDNWRWDP